MPKNVGDLGKLIAVKGFKNLPKVKKSPNLVTLHASKNFRITSGTKKLVARLENSNLAKL